jgi:tetratricopeptide (TPR) repeat protein
MGPREVATDESLNHLARAVLDGTPVDWLAAASDAPEHVQAVVHQLRVLESLVAVHRQEPGERWGHLEIRQRIGHGAFGAVYRAWDSRLDREVALKLMPARRTPADGAATSIIEEGRLLARVRHPNVLTIYGAELIGDEVGLWMELVPGETLDEQRRRVGRFSAAEVAVIGRELAAAVAAVHAAGLLHRDIKAHNVMRAGDGRVVLMDFGAGRELVERAASDLTGTPLYLAPEVLGGAPATVRSDIYSLGVLLFHLLTGHYPVKGRTIAEVRRAHDAGDRVALRSVRPDVPSPLARAIDRATAPNPSDRYQRAEELGAALASVAARAGPWPWLAAASVVIVAAGLSWSALSDRGRPTPRISRSILPPPAPLHLQRLGEAMELLSTRGLQQLRTAAEICKRIVEEQPLYPQAWAAITTALVGAERLEFGEPQLFPDPWIAKGVEEAMRLDSELADPHVALGTLRAYEGRWDEAEQAFRRALELDPRSSFAATEFVLSVLLPANRLDEAAALLTTARDRFPDSLDVRRVLALVQVDAGHYDDAIANADWVLARAPDFPYAKAWKGRALALSGRAEDALRLYGTDPRAVGYAGYAQAVLGRRDEAEAIARALGMQPERQLLIYGGLRDRVRALDALERLVGQSLWRAATWMPRPEVAFLRDEPRYKEIRRRMGFDR